MAYSFSLLYLVVDINAKQFSFAMHSSSFIDGLSIRAKFQQKLNAGLTEVYHLTEF